MSIKDNYKVKSIDSFQCKDWLLNKHYARRMPPISFSFGLFKENILIGVMTFGYLGGNANDTPLFDGYSINELNRLCVNDGLDKNVLSYFVSNGLNLLPKPMAIISYADAGMGHHGYIYQATNWVYCGMTKGDILLTNGNETIHRKSFYDKYGSGSQEMIKSKGYDIIKDHPKHRYFYFLGNKKQIADMKTKLKFNVLEYPKGENKRYDASYKPNVQIGLF